MAEITLEALQSRLGVVFSETLSRFWEAYVPDKVPPFKIDFSRTGKADFADLTFDPERGWLIRIRLESVDAMNLEVRLAHELFHLVLYREGYPAICPNDGQLPNAWNRQEWFEVLKLAHSILVHPFISVRMKEWGFPIEHHLQQEVAETLQVLKAHAVPEPDDFVYWRLWMLTYVLNSLDGGYQICEYIERRIPSIADEGEHYSQWLNLMGYSSLGSLVPSDVVVIGKELIARLKINAYCLLCVAAGNGFIEA